MTCDPLADPVFCLLAAAADWPAGAQRAARVRQLAEEAGGYARSGLMRLVDRHRVAPLVLDGLVVAGIEPPEALARRAAGDKRRALALLVEGRTLLATLQQAGIAAMILKGPLLSENLYGDPGMRQCADLDLLVDEADFHRARDILGEQGYRLAGHEPPWAEPRMGLWRRAAKDLTLVRAGDRITLELHYRLMAVPGLLPDLSLADAQARIALAGTSYRSFADADLFAYLCTHGASSLWNRLKWLADIRALLAGRKEQEIADLFNRASALGVQRCAALALLLCHHVWGQRLPAHIIDMQGSDAQLAGLMRLSLKAMADPDPRSGSIGSTGVTLAGFRLRDGWAFRRSALASALIDTDLVARWNLPRGLWMFYLPARLLTWANRRVR